LSVTVAELPKDLHQHDFSAALLALLFPTFGAALTLFGYYPERRKAMRLLAQAFQPR
jgi:hypothetical protein